MGPCSTHDHITEIVKGMVNFSLAGADFIPQVHPKLVYMFSHIQEQTVHQYFEEETGKHSGLQN